MNLKLRRDFQEKYQDAIKHDRPTITAAPFFSLKTRTIKQALSGNKSVAIFDLRYPLKDSQSFAKHIFLDSIEVAPFETTKKLIKKLQQQDKTTHLITHLYHYELALKLLPDAEKLFPQLLSSHDIHEIKSYFSRFPETDDEKIHKYVDYFQGLPAIVHTFDSAEKLEIIKRFAQALSHTPEAKPKDYFQKLANQYLKLPQSILQKAEAIDLGLAKKPVAIRKMILNEYLTGLIDLKQLADQIDAKLWHYVKYGWLWLDQERSELKVPTPLARLS